MLDKLKAYVYYFKYVFKHKYYVARECFKYGLYWRGIVHDMSKFLPSEFFGYAGYCNCNIYREKNKCKKNSPLNLSWLKHEHRNDHHWQHWLLYDDAGEIRTIDMSKEAAIEMVCDWIGAGIVMKNPISCWYEENRDIIFLSTNTRIFVNKLLKKRMNKELI